jgi:putative addiction module component (TIGR02574 family)
MARDAAQLLHEGMELPAEKRAALADSLLDSLDTEIDADAERLWREEIEHRLASLNDGTVQLVPWSEVQTRLLHRLKDHQFMPDKDLFSFCEPTSYKPGSPAAW